MRGVFLATFVAGLASGVAFAQTTTDSWANLKQLRPGQKIEVVDVKLKSLKGTFLALSAS